MKLNLPVTNNRINVPKDVKIISFTDLKGIITKVNQELVDICGYSKEELIGKPHNILRHPDMPAAAFALMWATIQSGKPFMALVKNRAKSGDYYGLMHSSPQYLKTVRLLATSPTLLPR